MSTWSQITALVRIETDYGTTLPFHDMVRNVLHGAPKIYGSEGYATVRVIDWGLDNVTDDRFLHGNVRTGDPCVVCPRLRWCVHATERTMCQRWVAYNKKFRELAEQGAKYNGFDDMVALTDKCMVYIHGSLRDTTPERTKEEFKTFIEYIKNSFPSSGKPLKAKVIFKKIV